ncbi:MAG: SDR family oxidoreductase, partial [Candidatus Eisenbacteria bacterium]|nr:SDR family oxidoreductase [Candidatus Eisenbacteria bacterium]
AEEGASVAICGRDRERLDRAGEALARLAGGGRIARIAGDLALPEEPGRIVREAEEQLGGLSILVVNAGGPPSGSLLDLPESAWERAVQLTLMSAVRLTRAALPGMLDRGYGRVVYITSSTVKQPLSRLILSNVLRPGIVALAKTLAEEYATSGVTLNCVCPGPYRTERIEDLMRDRAAAAGISVEEATRRYLDAVPMKRLGDPSELGRVIAFLASDAASFVTGVSWSVDGGQIQGIFG